MKWLTLLLLCLPIFSGCDKAPPASPMTSDASGRAVLPQGDRRLGLGVTEGAVGYDVAFATAKSAGLQFLELPQQWDETHPETDRFDTPLLSIANQAYPATGTSVVLSLNPIDTTALRLPKRLIGKSFDDAQVVQEFCKFLDHAFEQLKDVNVVALSIGNEVDGGLGDHPTEWAAYGRFFEAIAKHVSKVRPRLPIGVKTTRTAAVVERTDEVAALNRTADAIMLTYYPLGADFRVRKLDAVGPDLDRACAIAGAKPVYLLEVGYPSGKENGSSEAQQADFVSAMFTAWDRHAAQIHLVNFVWLHDLGEKEAATLTAYYGSKNPAFASFLATLADSTVLQHVRVRPGDARQPTKSGWEPDGITTSGGPADVWIDHCSVTWSCDENISAATYEAPTSEPARRIFIRDCLIAEGLSNATHAKGEHSKGTLVFDGTQQVAIVGNLYASNTERNPVFKQNTSGVVVNNVIANSGHRAISASDLEPNLPKARIGVVGNVVFFGEATKKSAAVFEGEADAFFKDNEGYDWLGEPIPELRKPFPTLSKPPLWPEGLEARSTTAALWHIARFVGARPAQRDAIDTRIVRESLSGAARIIDSQDEVGGYPRPDPTTQKLDVPDHERRAWLEKLTREMTFGPE